MAGDQNPKNPLDPTQSISQFQDDLDTAVPEKLLGEKSLERRNSEAVLIRLEQGRLDATTAEKMGLDSYTPPHKGLQPYPALVLGPFSLSKVHDWVEQGCVSLHDYILKPYDRWKIVLNVFPDLASNSETISETTTENLTRSLTENDFGDDKAPPPDEELKIEEGTRFGGLAVNPEIETAPQTVSNQQRPEIPSLGVPLDAKISQGPQKDQLSSVLTGLLTPRFVFSAGAVLVLVGFFAFPKFKIPEKSSSLPPTKISEATDPKQGQDDGVLIPIDLRPIEGVVNYEDSDPLVKKIRPILLNYQKGVTILTDSDELLLMGFSQAGTSSWEARRLASNQLAVFLLSTQKIEQGLKVLEPIYEAVPGDAVTLLNLSLLSIVRNKWETAEQMSEAAQRTAPNELKWVAHVLLGRVRSATKGPYSEEAQLAFEEALRNSSNNLFVWGARLRAATQNEGVGRPSALAIQKLPRLMRAGLWADPDRLRDSPIAAPLAGHIIEAESLAGFQRAAELTSKSNIIRNSQRPYVRWLESRKTLNPVSQDLADAAQALSMDDDIQSQVLLAYTQKEQGLWDAAIRTLQQTLPLIEREKDIPVSSWPWTLAGDLHAERGEWDQAFVMYESALRRNANDVGALWGLALYFREKTRFVEAIQKREEVLSLDPGFIPARLRISRFEWHRRMGR